MGGKFVYIIMVQNDWTKDSILWKIGFESLLDAHNYIYKEDRGAVFGSGYNLKGDSCTYIPCKDDR